MCHTSESVELFYVYRMTGRDKSELYGLSSGKNHQLWGFCYEFKTLAKFARSFNEHFWAEFVAKTL